ncbi:uncharacterized protein ARMOST_20290 [Armillaria ostoyae]|uniref:Uncharacterized protein n=1 Tax=Armillaria ostoyae TaxID=47428 RepID=A0A284S6Y2_ARMOS|nr:uncharacterized protein ARMOST_20290 [Armillaria ostoyae]
MVDDLPGEIPIFPPSIAPCSLFLSILHKDGASSKRWDEVALNDDGKRENLEGGSSGYSCASKTVLVFNSAPRRYTVILRADITEGMGRSFRSLTFLGAYPPVIQAGAILARGDVPSSREQAHDGNGRRYSWRRVVPCARPLRFSTQNGDLKHEKPAHTTRVRRSRERRFDLNYGVRTSGKRD